MRLRGICPCVSDWMLRSEPAPHASRVVEFRLPSGAACIRLRKLRFDWQDDAYWLEFCDNVTPVSRRLFSFVCCCSRARLPR